MINKNDCFAVFDENENTADVFYSAYKNINELSALLLENTNQKGLCLRANPITLFLKTVGYKNAE